MAALDPALRTRLLEGEGCAGKILRNHILPNVVCSGAVEGRVKAHTVLPSLLHLTSGSEGEVMVEGARLVTRDVMATNGVVHLIDRVMVPPSAKVNIQHMAQVTTLV